MTMYRYEFIGGARCCGGLHRTIYAAVRCRAKAYRALERRQQRHGSMVLVACDITGGRETERAVTDTEREIAAESAAAL